MCPLMKELGYLRAHAIFLTICRLDQENNHMFWSFEMLVLVLMTMLLCKKLDIHRRLYSAGIIMEDLVLVKMVQYTGV